MNHILALNGSPCPEGNTMTLCRAVCDPLPGSLEVIHLYEADVAPCRGCGSCSGSGECRITGDGMPTIMASFRRARVLLLASPLHFSSLSAPMVAFISRLQPLWRHQRPPVPAEEDANHARMGGLVLTAGSSYPRMFQPARSVALAALNTLGVAFAGMATARNTDSISVTANGAAMEEADLLAERLRDFLTAPQHSSSSLPPNTTPPPRPS